MFNIKGHSGCELVIFVEDGQSFVKKISASTDYTPRLHAQAAKQKYFCDKLLGASGIVVPTVIRTGNDSFSMNFFHGKDPVTFFMSSPNFNIDGFFEKLSNFIAYEVSECEEQLFDKDGFLKKFYSVRKKVGESVVNFHAIEKIFNDLPVIKIPVGMCHGDLTFSNIIVGTDQKLCLIDFLDTFYESPLQDMVKIRQDTLYNWTPMVYNKNYDKARYAIVMNYLDKKFDSFFKEYEFYNAYYNAFQIMNYIRILPYAKKNKIKKNVIFNVEEMIT